MEEVQQKISESEQQHSRIARIVATICTPVFYEALVLTFLAGMHAIVVSPTLCIHTHHAEWGDRSQIATITMATNLNAYGVTVGAVIGHALCTGTAVVGGQLLALKISQRTVAFSGATLFLLFAINNLITSATK